MVPLENAEKLAPSSILVVEDEVLILIDTAEYLRRRGFVVFEATNADDAVRILRSGTAISLVFTDIRMPGSLDGFGLALFIRSHHPETLVLMTSGHIGAAECLPDFPLPVGKPYVLDDVAAQIEAMLTPDGDGNPK